MSNATALESANRIRLWFLRRREAAIWTDSGLWLWALAGMGGVLIYFLWDGATAIGCWPSAVFCGACTVAVWRTRGFDRRLAGVLTLLSAGAGGFAVADWHVGRNQLQRIDSAERAVAVSGWIAAIDTGARGRARLHIADAVIADTDQAGARIRILADPGDAIPGDYVRVLAVLSAPSHPAVPGGYDGAFFAYFNRLVATGYAVTAVEIDADEAASNWSARLARWRWHIAEHVRDRLPGRNGGLAAALLTGDRSGIPEIAAEALRISGLGHVLAISGLHMGLIAGGAFFLFRLLASALYPWARGRDPARPAAIAAMLVALGYLALSGASIPTQRAFIMAVVALGAVVAGRRAISLHTLAIALIAILIAQPQSLLSAGFQMSFAATGALIAVYQAWRENRKPSVPTAWRLPFSGFFGGLSTTSLVAGTATAGFSAFHFHRLASYGLIGNLAVMPVFSLWVMPCGALALLLMPFGLDAPVFWIMGQGLDLMMWLAEWVAGLPGAAQPVDAAPGGVLLIYAAGFILLVLGRWWMRGLGALVCLFSLAVWVLLPGPDLFVTDRGVVAGAEQRADGEPVWQVSTRRRDRFDVRVFLEGHGKRERPERKALQCDHLGCSGRFGDLRIAFLESVEQWDEDCRQADLIISQDPIPVWMGARCPAHVFDAADLEAQGSALIWLRDGQIDRIVRARPQNRVRPWMQPPARVWPERN